jgi:M6 family metalloprotease-like protein
MKSPQSILVLACAIAGLAIAPRVVLPQPVPPAPGVDPPQAYFDRVAGDPMAFQFQKAWIEKTRRAKDAREKFLSLPRPDGMTFASLPDQVKRSMMVSGTSYVPVLMGKFSNTGADPYPTATLQTKLFSPPPALSMTSLYDEMSYGSLNLTGTVYGWYQASNIDTYYEGGCNGLCESAKTGQFILEVLQLADPAVDFGTYDNDGPDGAPNSGDDDGFVDFVAIVHPEGGAECGGTNLWSHRWVVGGWPEFGSQPWVTDDPRTGGGSIVVWDYTIQPALGSGSTGCGPGTIEIGVFCHEFGHAFGLPDLYDWDGGASEGIGHWGLMGSGNWNRPPNPAHMCAWSKAELGWVIPTDVGPSGQLYTIDNAEASPQVYRLNVAEEKFSRKSVLGSYRMHCGLTTTEAAARGWQGGAGYGNAWDEAIEHEFPYDGTGPVSFECDYAVHTETDWDFGYLKMDVNGTVTTLAQFDDFAVGHAVIDLTPYLSGSGATSYRLIAQFVSDAAVSDEDGVFNSGTAGPFSIDNVTVVGGGASYFADFDDHEEGWHYAGAASSKEYFLVENRDTTGCRFDKFLHNRGLAVWHVEQNMMAPGGLGNSGGELNTVIRGVTLEEADGENDVLTGQNRGDAGDVFPGTSSNTTFSNFSLPSSKSCNDGPTVVAVESISAPGPQMSAWMRSGRFPPAAAVVTPHIWYNDREPIDVGVVGSGFSHGVVFMLRDSGMNERPASPVAWLGGTHLSGTLDVAGLVKGTYDVVVRNPDGQESVLAGAFEVRSIVPVFIQAFDARATAAGIELAWEIASDEDVLGFRIARREAGAGAETDLQGGRLIEPDRREYTDDTVSPATDYEYFLTVMLEAGEVRSSGAAARSAAFALDLWQNVPNPFNPSTRISFTLPERAHVVLSVHDVKGRAVVKLVDERLPAGMNEAFWDGRDSRGARVASGIYFCRLKSGDRTLTKKMLLLK